MHNSIRKYFVGNLVTAAPPQYSSAIRLWRIADEHGLSTRVVCTELKYDKIWGSRQTCSN